MLSIHVTSSYSLSLLSSVASIFVFVVRSLRIQLGLRLPTTPIASLSLLRTLLRYLLALLPSPVPSPIRSHRRLPAAAAAAATATSSLRHLDFARNWKIRFSRQECPELGQPDRKEVVPGVVVECLLGNVGREEVLFSSLARSSVVLSFLFPLPGSLHFSFLLICDNSLLALCFPSLLGFRSWFSVFAFISFPPRSAGGTSIALLSTLVGLSVFDCFDFLAFSICSSLVQSSLLHSDRTLFLVFSLFYFEQSLLVKPNHRRLSFSSRRSFSSISSLSLSFSLSLARLPFPSQSRRVASQSILFFTSCALLNQTRLHSHTLSLDCRFPLSLS